MLFQKCAVFIGPPCIVTVHVLQYYVLYHIICGSDHDNKDAADCTCPLYECHHQEALEID